MKNLLIILVLSLTSTLFGQKDTALYEFSGQIGIVEYSSGGARMPDYMFEPRPYSATILIVEITHNDSVPKVVAVVSSKMNGEFSTKLPAGTYGFVTPAEENNIKPGQSMPTAVSTQSNHMSYYQGWDINLTMPYKLKQDTKNVVITYYNTSSCMDCP
ncbi:hypothetical protein K6119_15725 [Paracrocinitomix mangrovi]|uniref:hypothetical protein n=1 Tax=Paracrocinitomix mangrovi TaxID=2862509 RepID=UPI001C8D500C|nr:hypothetical protein [Paracrocinitomix mangrovi]UKN01179.1 hypothetical protein K6119_15725 [Paracrocinitomix mangrovi]